MRSMYKQFTRVKGLNTHTLIPTEEKPYSCNKCKKPFTTAKILKKHLFIRAEENLYSSGICKKRFTEHSSLNIQEYQYLSIEVSTTTQSISTRH